MARDDSQSQTDRFYAKQLQQGAAFNDPRALERVRRYIERKTRSEKKDVEIQAGRKQDVTTRVLAAAGMTARQSTLAPIPLDAKGKPEEPSAKDADGVLPPGEAGDILYHDGTTWVKLAAPTVSSENPALRHNGTAPYWEEPEDC